MNCPVTEAQLALFSTGDLDAAARAHVAAHIAECSSCLQSLVDFERTASLLNAAFDEPDGRDLLAVRTAVRSGIESSNGWFGWRSLLAAALLLISVLLAPTLRGRKSPKATSVVTPIQSLDLPLARLPVHLDLPAPVGIALGRRVAHRLPVMSAGLRSTQLVTTTLGQQELRIATADPNVLILLPMDNKSHAN